MLFRFHPAHLLSFFMFTFFQIGTASPRVTVSLRSYSITHCEYYSSTAGDFNVTLQDNEIKPTSKVILVAGFQQTRGHEVEDWTAQREVAMTQTTTGQVSWAALFGQDIAYRGGGSLTEMQFVFKVITNSGETLFEKGNSSGLGYYAASISNQLSCINNGPFFPLALRSVEKN